MRSTTLPPSVTSTELTHPDRSAARNIALRVDWGIPAAGASLPPNEVHVALALIERPGWPEDELANLLSPAERAQAAKFRFESDRSRFTVCRGMLRLWLGHHLGVEPAQIEFSYGPNGKPSVVGCSEEFHFNLSHSGGLAAFAITRIGSVGIDLERVHELPGWEQISVLCFAPEERARLTALPEAERLQQFFRLWTRHEGWLKAYGAGLGGAPTREGSTDDSWAQPGVSGLLETFTPAPGYIASVAVLFTNHESSA